MTRHPVSCTRQALVLFGLTTCAVVIAGTVGGVLSERP
jgi:hypothetical protein